MTAQVPEAARQLAGRLADAFETDRGLAEQLNTCQDRLRAANGQLWSGLHPDALGLLYEASSNVYGALRANPASIIQMVDFADQTEAIPGRLSRHRRWWAILRRSAGPAATRRPTARRHTALHGTPRTSPVTLRGVLRRSPALREDRTSGLVQVVWDRP